MTPARFRWGMLLILVGTLLLLGNLGVISVDILYDIPIYLPLFLIAIGIEKIFTRSRMEFLSYASSVLFVGAVVYMSLEWRSSIDVDSNYYESSEYSQAFDPAIQQVKAVLNIEDGDLTIRDATSELIYGRFREWSPKPDIDYAVDGSKASVTFTNKLGRGLGNLIHVETGEPEDWWISFSEEIPLYFECYGKGSDIHLNFSTTPLRDLLLDADDAEVYLKLGDLMPQVTVSIKGSDSKLRLRIPESSGVKINGREHERLLEKLGLMERDGLFYNGGYDTLINKIDLDLDDRFQSLSIDFY